MFAMDTVPYQVYLDYTYALTQLPEKEAMMYPSVFLQRYARKYHKETGKEEPLVFEPWQVFAVDDPAGNAIYVKPRQVGFSFLRAARGLAKSLLRPNYTAVFVSYNRDEAKNKILYARELYESMQYKGKPLLKTDNTAELRFTNGSRIISLPAKAVRGYSDPDTFGDEWAFVPKAQDIYSGTLSSAARGSGSFTVGSTPYGEANHFYDIWTNDRNQFKRFYRHRIEWWYSVSMCQKYVIPQAMLEAPLMSTDDRVEKFGSPKLQELRDSMSLEDFQREHECSFSARDDTVVPRVLLASCAYPEEETPEGEETQPEIDKVFCYVENFKNLDEGDGVEQFMVRVYQALKLMNGGSVFRMGFDIGRSRDGSMLVIVEETRMRQLITRACLGVFNTKLSTQEAVLKRICEDSRMLTCHIDSTGLGTQLAEAVRDHIVPKNLPPDEGRVRCINFAAGNNRTEVLTSIKAAVEAVGVQIPQHDDVFRHFASWKHDPAPGAWGDNYKLLKGVNKDGSKHHCEIVVGLGLALFGYTRWAPQKPVETAQHGPPRAATWRPGRKGYRNDNYRQHGSLYIPAYLAIQLEQDQQQAQNNPVREVKLWACKAPEGKAATFLQHSNLGCVDTQQPTSAITGPAGHAQPVLKVTPPQRPPQAAARAHRASSSRNPAA